MWNAIKGHDINKEFLKDLLQGERKTPSLLFYGTEGIGKKMLAFAFAQSFLCLDPLETGEACGKCRACKSFLASAHPDFVSVCQLKEGKDILIEQIKEMSQKANIAPRLSKYKVCVLEAADFMNQTAANSLLKLLEEPPDFWLFILIASNKNKLLPTILSRVVQLKFQNLSEKTIIDLLGSASENAQVYAKLADGSIAKAKKLAQSDSLVWRDRAFFILQELPTNIPTNFIESQKWLDKSVGKMEGLVFFEFMLYFLRDFIYLKENITDDIINIDKIEDIKKVSCKWDFEKIKKAIKIVNESHIAVESSAGAKAVIERMILCINRIAF